MNELILELHSLLLEFEKRNHSVQELLNPNLAIPISIFDLDISPLESLCLYLSHEHKMSALEIARHLKRHPQTIKSSLSKANSRIKIHYPKDSKENRILKRHGFLIKSQIRIPLLSFSTRKHTVFELIVMALKSQGFKNYEIAYLLHRDPRTIWTISSRAVNKNGY